jgi:hypothetical protein
MRLFVAFALLAGICLISGNGLMSQEKKDPPKAKGQLPKNWSKLELTAAQKQEVYEVQSRYKKDIDKLKEKIKEMQAEELKEMLKVLSADQKKKLQELTLGASTKDEPKKDTPTKKDAAKTDAVKKDTDAKPKDKN